MIIEKRCRNVAFCAINDNLSQKMVLMNNKIFIKCLQLIFIVSIIICLLSFPSIPEGKQADSDTLDFSLAALDGEKVSLKDYRGEKVLAA